MLFKMVLEKWEQNVEMLSSDRKWREWIFRDRTEYAAQRWPDPSLFPDPRCAARLTLARNLGVNMRVSQKMRKIANRWRYQHADRFEDYDEYHECHSGDMTKVSKQDADNALAISALIETMQKNDAVISGLDEEASKHIHEIKSQISCLFPDRAEGNLVDMDPIEMPEHVLSRVDLDWHENSRTTDVAWARHTLRELLKRKPDDPESDENPKMDKILSDSLDNVQIDDVKEDNKDDNDCDLRAGLSDGQKIAFEHAIHSFSKRKPLRMFVHGGPGTGKSFLAERIMTAAKKRGIVSRFTALSGAAATVNNGTTIHYITGLKRFCTWGRAPTPNCVKQIHERSRGLQVAPLACVDGLFVVRMHEAIRYTEKYVICLARVGTSHCRRNIDVSRKPLEPDRASA